MSEYNQTRSFNLGIAKDTSVEAALIYDDLAYAEQMVGRGEWFFRSYEQLSKRLPFSNKTLRRHVEKLIDGGWIEKRVMKIKNTPVCHYKIARSLETVKMTEWETVKMTDSIETVKMTDSINITTILQPKGVFESISNPNIIFDAEEKENSAKEKEATPSPTLLTKLINIVNPREKTTQERLGKLNARLKDYTEQEIIDSAIAFSKSQWHKDNKRMTIDNLLAPGKFGAWYANREDKATQTLEQQVTVENQDEMVRRRMAD